MKCKIPEISWHNRDPVLSVDIQPKNNSDGTTYRLASGGTDAHVLIWYLNLKDHDIDLDLAADLTRHQRAVNVVKWSPNGEFLASGDDESVVFIWKQKAENEALNITETANEQDKEVWLTLKVLRGHMEDIYDLSWSPNSQFLLSGSVDNSAMIWDVHKGKYTAMLTDHKGFVQGVTWDPKNQYVATLSTDRYLRIFDIQTKRVVHRVNKANLPVPEGNECYGQRVRLFHDDTLQTFFRRLCFTPDGKFLLTPAGVIDYEGATKPIHTTYLFSRYSFKQPAIVLPCPDQYTVGVRACPILFKLRPYNKEKNPPVISLPYRMIFAIATKSSVYFYDTQQKQPFALISNIHYTRLTDITWSNDGRIVVVSSTDGFCSLITFEEGELGEVYEDSQAVLDAALSNDTLTNKKSKQKSKENDGAGQQQKSRKSSVDEVTVNIDGTASSNTNKTIEEDKPEEKNEDFIPRKKPKDSESESKEEKILNIGFPNPSVEESLKEKKQEKLEEKTRLEAENSKPAPTPIAFRRKPKDKPENKPESKEEIKCASMDNVITNKGNENVNNNCDKSSLEEKQNENQDVIKDSKTDFAHTAEGNIAESEGNKMLTPPKENNSVHDLNPNATTTDSPITIKTVLPADIIIDKEILSSDEKFESPEKKSRPATPITIRRQPRTPSTSSKTTPSATPTIFSPIAANIKNSPLQQTKKATPIAIRRKPRSLIPPAPTPVNEKAVVEEAMDAWPIKEYEEIALQTTDKLENNKENPARQTSVEASAASIATPSESINASSNRLPPPSETTCEKTEDIRLVYEDTLEDEPQLNANKSLESSAILEEIESKVVPSAIVDSDAIEKTKEENLKAIAIESTDSKEQKTPSNKTPRRVPLRTISTPKSKKKLLE